MTRRVECAVRALSVSDVINRSHWPKPLSNCLFNAVEFENSGFHSIRPDDARVRARRDARWLSDERASGVVIELIDWVALTAYSSVLLAQSAMMLSLLLLRRTSSRALSLARPLSSVAATAASSGPTPPMVGDRSGETMEALKKLLLTTTNNSHSNKKTATSKAAAVVTDESLQRALHYFTVSDEKR